MMNKQQAMQVIEQALNMAQAKGVFSMKDSATILAAVESMKLEELDTPVSDAEVAKRVTKKLVK